MTEQDIPLWQHWSEKSYVKEAWFFEGYETKDDIYRKVAGNGYCYPFIVEIDDKPIGYIQCCDLYAYRNLCENPKGCFTQEDPGTFCLDIFIGEEAYLNKGYGTLIIKQFTDKIINEFNGKLILIDPESSNYRAINCYKKAGFEFVKIENDGTYNWHIMKYTRPK
jgi:aminoglycoside 6'-N-acetyltransferase